MNNLNLYAVGKITGVFGVKGHLTVLPYAASGDRLKKLSQVRLGSSADETAVVNVEDVSFKNGRWMIKLSHVDDRSAAQKNIGMFLFVDESEIEPPPAGAYYSHEVIGCEAWSEEGKFLGVVEDIYAAGAHDLWAIRTGTALSYVPAVKEFIVKVNVKERKIIVHVIDGLINEGQEKR